ncbi:MAG: NGG1p interacting factor NIF3 [bacterium]|nr:NGG1p interacting factor NIF3 [bacterium]
MKIIDIYNLAIEMGIEADFRGEKEIQRKLDSVKEKYDKLNEKEKELFDREKLTNPYSDTRMLFGDTEKEIKRILVGIDIEGQELIWAKENGVDLVMSHHPEGLALGGLDDVMDLQIDVLAQNGVPINIAEKLLHKRIQEVARGISPANVNRVVDFAKLVGVPFINIHSPADNLAADFLDKKIKEKEHYFVKDIMNTILDIQEYREAEKLGVGPKIFVGNPENRAGKIVLTEMTGGTSGSSEIYEKLAQAGAGTIIGMHMQEKHREEAEKAHINVVIAGHISSDSLGMNLFLDELEKQGIEIIPCGGLTRVKRI